ncbi:STAS domain-containing protein [Fictibacillus sp. 18YEL24]|uniref:STAS domain-containing protein n=1 Tax=Fictibacillus sp. 18YEL24 TaxID=2745875 RepID=UPI0018CDA567|nr:STAS domain-containing protein [Fictibacillus sp. 18YEL24]MBH0171466.1 STAS domain-containing protein [Fictibacillus sp. 18YEL24]
MNKDEKLLHYMCDKTKDLTEAWYQSLDKSHLNSVFSSNDPAEIELIKQQNYEFHKRFCTLFDKEVKEEEFLLSFEPWIVNIARDKKHLETPIHLVLRELFRTQDQYLNLLNEFIEKDTEEYDRETENQWRSSIIQTFAKVLVWFTQEINNYASSQLEVQKEMILELSSPIILLNKDTGLLPLIGEIDTARAKHILQHTLTICSEKRIKHLFLDLSGVLIIDTMVAQQIFQLINTLDLLGVKSTLSGIRPEIAQTAVQLGLDFNGVSITSTLERAISLKEKKIGTITM